MSGEQIDMDGIFFFLVVLSVMYLPLGSVCTLITGISFLI